MIPPLLSRPRPGSTVASLVLMTALLVMQGQVSAEPRVRETHRDWTVVCDVPEQMEEEVCLIVQQKNLKDTNQPVLRVEIGFAVQTKKPFAVITAPLGIALPPGLSMNIDGGEAVLYQFGSCIPAGCIVGTGLTDEQLAALKRGTEASFTFQDNRRRNITVPVSLQGFTAAISTVEP